jgi:hypothetical protein
MTENPDLRSVRVVLDADSVRPTDAPHIDESASTSRFGLITGFVGFGLVVFLMVLALRPDSDAAADGGTSSFTSSAVGVNEERKDSVAITTLSDSSQPGLFSRTSGTASLLSMAKGQIGYLGLTSQTARTPEIRRSTDGVDWSRVQAVLGESVDPWSPGTDRMFVSLVRSNLGFGVLMVTTDDQSRDQSGGSARIERLFSTDGAVWEIDERFPTVYESDGYLDVLSHNDQSFSYATRSASEANPELGALLREHVVDGERFTEVCETDRTVSNEFQFDLCDRLSTFTVGAADVVEPDRFDSLRDCIVYVVERGYRQREFNVVRVGSSGPTAITDATSPVFAPVVADDGTAVMFDAGSPPSLDPNSCDGFIELDESPSPAVVVWRPDDTSGLLRLPIPDEIDLIDLLSTRTQIAMSGREVLILNGSSVTSIDIDTGEWDDVLTLQTRLGDETSTRFTVDGAQLVQLDSSRVTVTDLRTGEQRSREDVGGGNRPAFPRIFYADDQLVLALGANSLFAVELP